MAATKIPARDVKLLRHRWAMHAVQALSQRDAELLTRVFTEIDGLPQHAVDTQVRTFGCGAALQFHDYGFFDESSRGYGAALLDKVVRGDTLLLIALRRHDPQSAAALVKCEASLEVVNSLDERAIDVLFDVFAAFQLCRRHEADPSGESGDRTPNGLPLAPLLGRRSEYEALLTQINGQLDAHHGEVRSHVEAELYRIYAQYAPERLAKIETQLADFEYREMQLLAGVRRKYEA